MSAAALISFRTPAEIKRIIAFMRRRAYLQILKEHSLQLFDIFCGDFRKLSVTMAILTMFVMLISIVAPMQVDPHGNFGIMLASKDRSDTLDDYYRYVDAQDVAIKDRVKALEDNAANSARIQSNMRDDINTIKVFSGWILALFVPYFLTRIPDMLKVFLKGAIK